MKIGDRVRVIGSVDGIPFGTETEIFSIRNDGCIYCLELFGFTEHVSVDEVELLYV